MNRYSIYVSSADKFSTAETAGQFSAQLTASIDKITKCRLQAAIIPLSMYNVDSTNNLIYFIEDAGVQATATLTAGLYTTTTLATEIAARMTAVSPNARTYTVAFSTTTQEFTITVSAGTFRLLFATNTTARANVVMGFTAVDGVLAATQTGTTQPMLNRLDCIYVRSNIVSGSYIIGNVKTEVSNVLACIPCNVSLGQVLTYVNPIDDWKRCDLTGCKKIDFTLTDQSSNIIDLRGLNVVITLEFI